MSIHELKIVDGKPERGREFKELSLTEMADWFNSHPMPEWDRPLTDGMVKTAEGERREPLTRDHDEFDRPLPNNKGF